MSQTWLIIILAVLGVLILIGIILCISIMRNMYRNAGSIKSSKKKAISEEKIEEEDTGDDAEA